MITCGMFPSLAIILRRSIVSVLPTMSSRYTGLYFSTLIRTQHGGQGKVGGEYHGRSYIAPPRPLTLALMPFLAAAADDSAFAIALPA